MAVGSITKNSLDSCYKEISAHEEKLGVRVQIVSFLALLFYVSQAEEATSAIDFFSGRNLPITECFEDMNAFYELIKMGLNKQSFIALRVGLDNGIVAAYWKAIGHKTKGFRRWLQSIDPTPRKTKAFWEAIKSVPTVRSFFEQFPLEQDINDLDELNNYVHTRGSDYATVTDFQKKVQSRNSYVHFEKWLKAFKASARVVAILQLLVNPKLALSIPDDLLLQKYGTYHKIPFMGLLFGGHDEEIGNLVGQAEHTAILGLAKETNDVKSIIEYLQGLPNLAQDEIQGLILDEQKKHILELGFGEWFQNRLSYDHRINAELIQKLQIWIEGLKANS